MDCVSIDSQERGKNLHLEEGQKKYKALNNNLWHATLNTTDKCWNDQCNEI